MTAAVERKPAPESPPVSKVLEDRIAADGEQVSHTLDPDRRPDTVRYPDPQAPHEKDDGRSVSPQSNAEVQMARRTDAGASEAVTANRFGDAPSLLMWGVGAVALFLLIAILIAVI